MRGLDGAAGEERGVVLAGLRDERRGARPPRGEGGDGGRHGGMREGGARSTGGRMRSSSGSQSGQKMHGGTCAAARVGRYRMHSGTATSGRGDGTGPQARRGEVGAAGRSVTSRARQTRRCLGFRGGSKLEYTTTSGEVWWKAAARGQRSGSAPCKEETTRREGEPWRQKANDDRRFCTSGSTSNSEP